MHPSPARPPDAPNENPADRSDSPAYPLHGRRQVRRRRLGGKDLKTVDSLLLKVSTDTGLVGWGESFGFAAVPLVKAAIDTAIAPLCIGREPVLIEKLMQELQRTLHIFGRSGAIMFGLSALDIALWDIAGKAVGQPVHRLLGGSDVPALSCYASLIRYTDPELVAENAQRALGLGYTRLKLHEIDPACVRAAREVAGDQVEITLDVNCPWSVREALDMARRLQPYNLRWLEEPVWPPENHGGLARLRREGGIPIAAERTHRP